MASPEALGYAGTWVAARPRGEAILSEWRAVSHSPEELLGYLARLGIETTTIEHAPVFTVEESRHLRGAIAGAHTKNLFLRDNKRRLFLLCLEEDAVVDLKRLRDRIGARGGLSFASPDALSEHLGVQPGSVSPFAVLNDAAGAVTVAIGGDLLAADVVNCHPLTNTRTTSIAPADLLVFLRATGHEPLVVTSDDENAHGDRRETPEG